MHPAMHLDGECACRAELSPLSPGLGTRMMKTQETLPDCDSKAAPGRGRQPGWSSRFAGRLRGRLSRGCSAVDADGDAAGGSIGYKDQDKAVIPRPKYRRHKALGRA